MKKEDRELSSDAYQEIPGDKYEPYIWKEKISTGIHRQGNCFP
jgi:hypothetical protein